MVSGQVYCVSPSQELEPHCLELNGCSALARRWGYQPFWKGLSWDGGWHWSLKDKRLMGNKLNATDHRFYSKYLGLRPLQVSSTCLMTALGCCTQFEFEISQCSLAVSVLHLACTYGLLKASALPGASNREDFFTPSHPSSHSRFRVDDNLESYQHGRAPVHPLSCVLDHLWGALMAQSQLLLGN